MKEKAKKVYIIDAGTDFRFVCRESLMNLGFAVVGDTGDGQEALREIPRLEPDVVLLDLWFPGYDLASLIREVKRCMKAKAPKFILVTAVTGRQILEDAFAGGINSVVIRPFDYDALADKIIQVTEMDRF